MDTDNSFEIIAIVIFAFVLIFVVLLYVLGADVQPSFGTEGLFATASAGLIDVMRRYINPIFIVLDIVLLGATIYAMVRGWEYRPTLTIFYKKKTSRKKKRTQYRKFRRGWEKIVAGLDAKTPEAYRLAVIDADAFVDSVLKSVGYEGDHMADRLSQIIPTAVESLEGVWQAHRLRNNLVHAHGIVITRREAEGAIKSYEAFLREIGIL